MKTTESETVSITDHVSETTRSSIKRSVIDASESCGGDKSLFRRLVVTDLFTDPSAMRGF